MSYIMSLRQGVFRIGSNNIIVPDYTSFVRDVNLVEW